VSRDEEELSDGPEEWENGLEIKSERRKRRKRDEPMSPIAVVCYVVFFYIIWQILTRSDETEILGHLPLSHLQSLSSSLHSDLRSQPQSQYHLPYHLPQIPSPIPNTQAESASTTRTLLGVLMYPFYLILTLIATPFPLILNLLSLIIQILGTVLYPITATARLMGQTFVLAPFGIVSNVLAVFYPVYVFVAGVIGVGCVLGLGVGWVGKLFLDLLFGKKRRSAGHGRQGRAHSTRARSAISFTPSQDPRRKTTFPSSGEDREYIKTPHVRSKQNIHDDDDDFQMMPERTDRSGAKGRHSVQRGVEVPVVGLRKRGARSFLSER
jgi:hypothetical protein